jgi:hypothetical protein
MTINSTASATTRWVCTQCGHAVSKQVGQHKHLRVRRPDGTGWDHARCQPPHQSVPLEVPLEEALLFRRRDAGLR